MKTVFLDTNILVDYALGKRVRDFEDMLQYQCAIAAGCDVIITNNGRDFEDFCTLPFMSAADFLEQMNK